MTYVTGSLKSSNAAEEDLLDNFLSDAGGVGREADIERNVFQFVDYRMVERYGDIDTGTR